MSGTSCTSTGTSVERKKEAHSSCYSRDSITVFHSSGVPQGETWKSINAPFPPKTTRQCWRTMPVKENGVNASEGEWHHYPSSKESYESQHCRHTTAEYRLCRHNSCLSFQRCDGDQAIKGFWLSTNTIIRFKNPIDILYVKKIRILIPRL